MTAPNVSFKNSHVGNLSMSGGQWLSDKEDVLIAVVEYITCTYLHYYESEKGPHLISGQPTLTSINIKNITFIFFSHYMVLILLQ